MKMFTEVFDPTSSTRVLDVGGTRYNWDLIDCEPRVTILNLDAQQDSASSRDNLRYVEGDGTNLQFSDNAFDIGYSNSVIEHLGTFENQAKFAAEIRRVAQKVWVQTPARSFPIEPHLLTPFFHYLPRRWQRRLMRNFTVHGLLTRPAPEVVERNFRELRLLNLREMRELFPDCVINKERFLGLTKSFIAIRR